MKWYQEVPWDQRAVLKSSEATPNTVGSHGAVYTGKHLLLAFV